MSVPNISPATISFKQAITLTTTDASTNNPVSEGYIVNGPVSAGVTPIIIPGKVLIPLSNTSGNGAPYLKFWLPNPSSGNTLYMTYAVQNSSMADGYYDYQTGVPSSFVTSLRNWINTNPVNNMQYSIPLVSTVKSRTLKFTSYGAATNDPSAAVTFYVTFTGTFGFSNIAVSNVAVSNSQVSFLA